MGCKQSRALVENTETKVQISPERQLAVAASYTEKNIDDDETLEISTQTREALMAPTPTDIKRIRSELFRKDSLLVVPSTRTGTELTALTDLSHTGSFESNIHQKPGNGLHSYETKKERPMQSASVRLLPEDDFLRMQSDRTKYQPSATYRFPGGLYQNLKDGQQQHFVPESTALNEAVSGESDEGERGQRKQVLYQNRGINKAPSYDTLDDEGSANSYSPSTAFDLLVDTMTMALEPQGTRSFFNLLDVVDSESISLQSSNSFGAIVEQLTDMEEAEERAAKRASNSLTNRDGKKQYLDFSIEEDGETVEVEVSVDDQIQIGSTQSTNLSMTNDTYAYAVYMARAMTRLLPPPPNEMHKKRNGPGKARMAAAASTFTTVTETSTTSTGSFTAPPIPKYLRFDSQHIEQVDSSELLAETKSLAFIADVGTSQTTNTQEGTFVSSIGNSSLATYSNQFARTTATLDSAPATTISTGKKYAAFAVKMHE